MNPSIQDYLNKAAGGLYEDAELQLEVRAELSAHAEEKLEELQNHGTTAKEAIEQTINALGDPLELATDLFEANRRRMNLRAQIRLFLRFALVPLAMLSTLWNSGSLISVLSEKIPFSTIDKSLSQHEQLILHGDLSRPSKVEQQKAIWESDPTNRVYFGNYFGVAAKAWKNDRSKLPPQLIETAKSIDPDNALYLYMEALHEVQISPTGACINTAIAFDQINYPTSAEDDEPLSYEVLDRARLDRSMALFEEALAKPYFKTYSAEMLHERHSMLPPAQSLMEKISYIGLNAGSFNQPLGLTYYRKMSTLMAAYGDLLIREGQTERAERFLNAWKILPRQLATDSHTLVEIVIASTLPRLGYNATLIYRAAGFEQKADALLKQVEIALKPGVNFNQKRKAKDHIPLIEDYGGILAAIGTPSVPMYGSPLTQEDFAPSRRLEYTVLTQGIVRSVSLILLTLIIFSATASLLWRLKKTTRMIPILLVPNFYALVRILGLGIALPSLLFFLITRIFPWSGHEYSAFSPVGSRKLLIEFGLLTIAFITVPAILAVRHIRNRCTELDIPVPNFKGRWIKFSLMIGSAMLAGLWMLPAATPEFASWIAGILVAILFLLLFARVLQGLVQWARAKGKWALFYGTLIRTIAPLLALSLLLLNHTILPFLYVSEVKYIQSDTLFNASDGPITSIEAAAIKHLRTELLNALQDIESLP